MPSEAIQCKPLEVVVSDRGIERAIKMLKRKLASEGVLRELKMRRHYMKPSVKRRKKQAEAARRRRKRAKMDCGAAEGEVGGSNEHSEGLRSPNATAGPRRNLKGRRGRGPEKQRDRPSREVKLPLPSPRQKRLRLAVPVFGRLGAAHG